MAITASSANGSGTPSPRRWRLRTRLAAALLLVFIPIFALVAVRHADNLDERRDSRLESLQFSAHALASSIDSFARDLESFVLSIEITLAQVHAGGTSLEEDIYSPYFLSLSESYNVRSIFTTTLDGIVISGSSAASGFDVSGRPYVQALQGGAEYVWSDALAGLETGQTTLVYGRVVRSFDGEPLVYIFVAMYESQLAERLPQDLPAQARLTLIDRSGTIIRQAGDAFEAELSPADVAASDIFQRAVAGNQVLLRGESGLVSEQGRYGVFMPLERTGWVLGLTVPDSAINAPLQRRLFQELAVLGFAFAGAFGLMLFIAGRLSSPLTDLASSAAAIARGERPPPQADASDRDVYELQRAMRTMSSAIEEREGRLREERAAAVRLANQLARLHASRNALASLLPPDEICAVVVREAVSALEAAAGGVFLPDEEQGIFRIAATEGYPPELEAAGERSMHEVSPFSEVYNSGEPLIFRDVESQNARYPDQAEFKRRAATQASAFLPLRSDEKVLGVLSMGFATEREFAPDEIELMFAFANQAAQALHRSQLYEAETLARERLEAVVGDIPGIVWEAWVDPDRQQTRIEYISPYVEQMLGYTMEECLSATNFWQQVVHEEDRDRMNPASIATARDDVAGTNEFRMMTKDGRTIWARAASTNIRDEAGVLLGMRGVTIDISEQKEAQLRIALLSQAGLILGQSLDYQATLQNLTNLIVPSLADWCSVHVVEEEDVRLVALSSDGHGGGERVAVEEAQFPPVLTGSRGVYHVIESGESELGPEPPGHAVVSAPADTSDPFPVRGYISVPLRTGAEVIGALTLVTSESGRTYNENDLWLVQELAGRAAQAIERARLYRDSELAREELIRSNEAKDEFLGIVAHELRTPVTSIFGGSRLLNDPGRSLPPDARNELMKNIEVEADKMVRLVENLLLLARVEMGRELETESMSVQALLRNAEDDLLRSYPGRQVVITNKLPFDEIVSDETSLRQILGNLLSNSAKYAPASAPIQIVVEQGSEGITFAVRDSGPGVKPEEMELIFESFYRSPGTARQASGKGIGLAVCRRLLEALGGRIWAQPRPGGGLQVSFSIPALRPGIQEEASVCT